MYWKKLQWSPYIGKQLMQNFSPSPQVITSHHRSPTTTNLIKCNHRSPQVIKRHHRSLTTPHVTTGHQQHKIYHHFSRISPPIIIVKTPALPPHFMQIISSDINLQNEMNIYRMLQNISCNHGTAASVI